MGTKYVNQPVHRLDAAAKVTGEAQYTGDLRLKGLLHGSILRSTHAHARIRHLDTAAAAALPGVKAVITGPDFPRLFGPFMVDETMLAVDRVRYWGEPVAAVAAVDAETAERALDLIRVEFEPLPILLDAAAARTSPVIIHPRLGEYHLEGKWRPQPGTNVAHHQKVRRGDIDQGFALASVVVTGEYTTPTQQHVCLEPRACVAQFDREGNLQMWASTQAPFHTRQMIADLFGLPLGKVRVSVPWLGGGFGSKSYMTYEPIAVALASRCPGRPVRVQLDRLAEFQNNCRHAVTMKLKTGAAKDGTLVAFQAEMILDTGAYADCGPRVANLMAIHLCGPYRIPHVWVDAYTVYTNKVPATAYRGYGVPKAAWAHELQMDALAARLEMDPVELRHRNVLRDGDESVTGQKLVAVGLDATLTAVAERLDLKHVQAPLAPHLRRGKGLAMSQKSTSAPAVSGAEVIYHPDSTVSLLTAFVDMGQGANTVLAQVAAEELNVPVANVTVIAPDTSISPFDRSTAASRGTFYGGNAVRLACQALIGEARRYAAELLELAPSDLEYADGVLHVVGFPQRRKTLPQVIRERMGAHGGPLIGRAVYVVDLNKRSNPDTAQGAETPYWGYSTQGAEVEVDTNTGLVRVLRMVAAHDVGTAINPATCRQQIEGGVHMGISATLTEEMHFDALGQIVNPNLVDYKLGTMADSVPVDTVLVEVPHPDGPFGAKGLGEPALTSTAAAIGNAVANAIGVRITDLPLTPERVLKALATAGR